MRNPTAILGALVLILGACTPPASPPPPTPAAPSVDLGLRAHAGSYYADFIKAPGMARFTPEALNLSVADRARLDRDMGVQAPAPIASGGGSEALVFEGCIAHDCPNGVGVVAIDVVSGSVFVGVHDAEGTTVLLPDDKIQALLEATSPSHRWDDPVTWTGPLPGSATPPAPPAAP